MTISTNQEPTIYRNLYENTGPGFNSVINSSHFRNQSLFRLLSHRPGCIVGYHKQTLQCATSHQNPSQQQRILGKSVMEMQTAVTAYLKSKQLLLFAFVRLRTPCEDKRYNIIVTADLKVRQLLLSRFVERLMHANLGQRLWQAEAAVVCLMTM